ncbi:unnamed protein product [Umbelopsis ramanniana]
MSTIKEKMANGLQTIEGSLLCGFYGAILYYTLDSVLVNLWNEGIHLYTISVLEPTICTILRLSIVDDGYGDSWSIHVNYTTPSSSSNFGYPHVSLLQDTDINTLYTVNSTIPCFYSAYDPSYATVYDGSSSAGHIIYTIVYAATCLSVIGIPLGFLVFMLHVLLPNSAALRSAAETAMQLASFVTRRSVVMIRKLKRFTPLAQSEEEAFILENSGDVIIGHPRDGYL